jgi:hypothetical protein
VAEVVRLPIGMTTLQDAADAFWTNTTPPRSTRRVYRASLASLVAGLSFPGGGFGVRRLTSFTPLVARAHGCRRAGPHPRGQLHQGSRSFQLKTND